MEQNKSFEKDPFGFSSRLQENEGDRPKIFPVLTSLYLRSKPRQPERELAWCPMALRSDSTHPSSALMDKS